MTKITEISFLNNSTCNTPKADKITNASSNTLKQKIQKRGENFVLRRSRSEREETVTDKTQAAIGSIPLTMGLACGQIVLTVAVLSILITAPFGAICIDNLYRKLLK